MVVLTFFAVFTVVIAVVLFASILLFLQRRHASDLAEMRTAQAESLERIAADRQAVIEAVQEQRELTVAQAGAAAADKAVQLAGTRLDDKLQAGAVDAERRNESVHEQYSSVVEALAKLNDMVTKIDRERVKQGSTLTEQLRVASETTKELAQSTQTLREALANPAARGQWGERMADDVLAASGLIEGINYRRQSATESGTIPDFTFMLPKGVELNMDVKFPISNYLRFLDADNDVERDNRRAQFAKDVRQRVKEVTTRDYIDPQVTVDYVLLFIPNEAVYAFCHENDGELIDWAIERKVVLCSPFTLFAVLAVIRQSVEAFQLEQTSSEILDCLVKFSAEWSRFTEQLAKVERHMTTTQNSFEALTGPRRRQLERELDRMHELRSRTEGGDHDAAESAGPLQEPTDLDEARKLEVSPDATGDDGFLPFSEASGA
jgi:DNA recombination protein RmuC